MEGVESTLEVRASRIMDPPPAVQRAHDPRVGVVGLSVQKPNGLGDSTIATVYGGSGGTGQFFSKTWDSLVFF